MIAFRFAAATIAAAAILQVPAAASAQGPARLTAHDFFRHPEFLGVSLSPDGLAIAATTPIDGRMALVAVNLKDRKPVVLVKPRDYDIVQFQWVNNERLVYSLGNINEPSASDRRTGGGLFAINRDGTEPRTLAPSVGQARARGDNVYRFLEFVAPTPEASDEIIAASNERIASTADVYRVNTRTGQKTLLTFENPGDVREWILDRNAVPRAAISGNDENRLSTWYRTGADAKWEKLGECEPFERCTLPLSVGYDGTLYAISNEGRDRFAIFTYDVQAKSVRDLVFEHPLVDVGVSALGQPPDPSTLIWDHQAKKLAGIHFEGAKPGVHWIDPQWKSVQAGLDQALPGRFNRFSPPRHSDRIVVRSHSDRSSETSFLYDRKAGTLERLLPTRSWLKEADLVEQRPYVVKTRDGLEIPGYLFLPRGKEASKLPLVVNVHGGPHVRADRWGLAMWGPMESQFLAHHGYAVLLPNFRLTPGFGHRIYASGLRQFAKAMQEDLEDGVDQLVKEGVVDPARVCMYGASYGGYATLMSLAKTPDKYRCGVAALVVSDLALQLGSTLTDFSSSKPALNHWYRMVGDPGKEPEFVRASSPAYHAARIKAPLLIVSGQDDRRTPIEQAEKMREALRKVGREPGWLVKPEEGHGFAKVDNRVDMYTKMLEFFDRHIGGK